MKNTLILLLGLFASTASFATSTTPPPAAAQTRLVMTQEQTLKVFVAPLQTKGQLTIWDATGHEVYTQTVSLKKGLHEQFDFSNLSTGTYRLTIQTGSETITKTFVVQADPNESFVMQEA